MDEKEKIDQKEQEKSAETTEGSAASALQGKAEALHAAASALFLVSLKYNPGKELDENAIKVGQNQTALLDYEKDPSLKRQCMESALYILSTDYDGGSFAHYFAANVFHKNQKDFDALMTNDPEDQWTLMCVRAATNLATHEWKDYPRMGLTFLERHADFIEASEQTVRSQSWFVYGYALTRLVLKGNDPEIAEERLQKILDSNPSKMAIVEVVKYAVMYNWNQEKVKNLFDQIGRKYGWNMDVFFKSWKNNSSNQDPIGFREDVVKNLSEMIWAERDAPGSTRYLHEECGITNFRRYPREMLIEQYNKREDADTPYGVICYPQSDHNGAFGNRSYEWQYLTESIDRLKSDGHPVNIRFVEIENKRELFKNLARLDRRYGDKQKISFMLLGGHGTPNSIQLGPDEDESHKIRVEDIERISSEKLASYFKPDFTLMLESCSTGKNGGIAQKISQALQCTVTAPSKDTPISGRIEVFFNGLNGNVYASQQFRDSKLKQMYINGINSMDYYQ